MRWIAASLLCLFVTGCNRSEPEVATRDETMPATAVARSTAAMLAEVPPNERIDPDPNEPPKPVASPASFDCAKSTPGVEVVICSDPNLAALDREMARLYGQAESEKPGDTLKRLQRGWLDKRNACAGAGSPAECLKAAYAERIHDLKVSYAAARAPGGISQGPEVWSCGDDTKLNVLYINAYNPMVVLDSSAGQVLLSRGESASGSRFAGGGYEFSQKGAEATYGRLGMPMTTCRKP
ncbi:MliC family protein [Asticcacaulis sp. AND118]|uniref:MliC family protein n=1 Tax=Asticcacaulis sp. AND118 TaxID=2840468 RepID=UPI001CFF5AA4|nr:MliC family protein [Asticcacaulis sp. AND118]UDF03661.1 MliC family protein [Asticcacaulis sp. AND118]